MSLRLKLVCPIAKTYYGGINHTVASPHLYVRADLAGAVSAVNRRSYRWNVTQVSIGVAAEDDRKVAHSLAKLHLKIHEDFARHSNEGEFMAQQQGRDWACVGSASRRFDMHASTE